MTKAERKEIIAEIISLLDELGFVAHESKVNMEQVFDTNNNDA